MRYFKVLCVFAIAGSKAAVPDDTKCDQTDGLFELGENLFRLAQNLTVSELLWDAEFTAVTAIDLLDIAATFVDQIKENYDFLKPLTGIQLQVDCNSHMHSVKSILGQIQSASDVDQAITELMNITLTGQSYAADRLRNFAKVTGRFVQDVDTATMRSLVKVTTAMVGFDYQAIISTFMQKIGDTNHVTLPQLSSGGYIRTDELFVASAIQNFIKLGQEAKSILFRLETFEPATTCKQLILLTDMIDPARIFLKKVRKVFSIHYNRKENYSSIGYNINAVYSLGRHFFQNCNTFTSLPGHLMRISTYLVSEFGYVQLNKLSNCLSKVKETITVDPSRSLLLNSISKDYSKLTDFLTTDIDLPLEQSAMAGWALLTGNLRIIMSIYLDGISVAADFADELSGSFNKQTCVDDVIAVTHTEYDDIRISAICSDESCNPCRPCPEWVQLVNLFSDEPVESLAPVKSPVKRILIVVLILVPIVMLVLLIVLTFWFTGSIKLPYTMGKVV